ncbi:hypothetical protein Bca4012_001004 [Brassica carinata]
MDEQKKCSSNAVLSMQLKEHASKKYAQNSKPKIRLASVVPPLRVAPGPDKIAKVGVNKLSRGAASRI